MAEYGVVLAVITAGIIVGTLLALSGARINGALNSVVNKLTP